MSTELGVKIEGVKSKVIWLGTTQILRCTKIHCFSIELVYSFK